MSYQARMAMPLLMVTGRTGAWGNTKRIGPSSPNCSSGTMGAKSLPSAPKPCSQITAYLGSGPVSISILSSSVLVVSFMVPNSSSSAPETRRDNVCVGDRYQAAGCGCASVPCALRGWGCAAFAHPARHMIGAIQSARDRLPATFREVTPAYVAHALLRGIHAPRWPVGGGWRPHLRRLRASACRRNAFGGGGLRARWCVVLDESLRKASLARATDGVSRVKARSTACPDRSVQAFPA